MTILNQWTSADGCAGYWRTVLRTNNNRLIVGVWIHGTINVWKLSIFFKSSVFEVRTSTTGAIAFTSLRISSTSTGATVLTSLRIRITSTWAIAFPSLRIRSICTGAVFLTCLVVPLFFSGRPFMKSITSTLKKKFQFLVYGGVSFLRKSASDSSWKDLKEIKATTWASTENSVLLKISE